MVVNALCVFGLPVRGQAHHLVFPRVDLEAGVVGERRVQETERVWKWNLPERQELVALAEPRRRRRPLTNSVHTQDRRRIERRGIEGGRGVRLVVLTEKELGQGPVPGAAGQR